MQTNPDNKSEGDIEKIVGLYSHSNELRDTFYSNSKKKKNVFHVLLNASGLVLQKDTLTVTGSSTKDHLIKISDIIGGRCVRLQNPGRFKSASSGCGVCTPKVSDKKGTENYEDAYLYVFAYILKKNRRNVVRRERTVITLRFRSFDSHDDNMREAEKWYIALKAHRDNYLNQYLPGTVSGRVAMKRLLILLNPKSGSGKARDMFHHQVVPVLNEAEIPYDLYVTKHSHYAFDFIRKRDLSVWSGIVAIGGDGLFHEILNGLLKRLDWESVINISLGIVPCGSGNGLARSIAHLFE